MKISLKNNADYEAVVSEAVDAANAVLKPHGLSLDKMDLKHDSSVEVPDEYKALVAICASYKGVTVCVIF
jgi:hypothetical protein